MWTLLLVLCFQGSTSLPAEEIQALNALYDSTVGTNWTQSEGWPDVSCSSAGVTCNDNSSHVTDLILTGFGLAGPLPQELTGLTQLTRLELTNNKITDGLPVWLSQLSNLKILRLSKNALVGSIPVEFAALSNLQILDLSQNRLTGGIPTELTNLTSLSELYLSFNILNGSIPAKIGNLKNLTTLSLAANYLGGPPPTSLLELTNLQVLDLRYNSFSGGIPTWFGQMSSLRKLDLNTNKFGGSIPAELGNLTNLIQLSLDRNGLRGSFPDQLANLVNIQNFYAGNNYITGGLEVTAGYTKLRSVLLDNNRLSGSIPASWAQFNYLMYMSMPNNSFTGSLSDLFRGHYKLIYFSLARNKLSGSLAADFTSSAATLQTLDLSWNAFTGSVPDFSDYSALKLVKLGHNQFQNCTLTHPLPTNFTYEIGPNPFACPLSAVCIAKGETCETLASDKTNIMPLAVGLAVGLGISSAITLIICVCWLCRGGSKRPGGLRLQRAVRGHAIDSEASPLPMDNLTSADEADGRMNQTGHRQVSSNSRPDNSQDVSLHA